MASRFRVRARRLAGSAVVLGAALALVAATAAAQASSGKPPTSGKYAGKASESAVPPVSFTVSANKRTITSFTATLGYDGKCGQGGGPTFSFKVPSMAIGASGSFSGTTIAKDNAAKATIQITGVISLRSAHGTIFEPKPTFVCRPPNQKLNAFSETFSASTS
jgi:hypothetical protein